MKWVRAVDDNGYPRFELLTDAEPKCDHQGRAIFRHTPHAGHITAVCMRREDGVATVWMFDAWKGAELLGSHATSAEARQAVEGAL